MASAGSLSFLPSLLLHVRHYLQGMWASKDFPQKSLEFPNEETICLPYWMWKLSISNIRNFFTEQVFVSGSIYLLFYFSESCYEKGSNLPDTAKKTLPFNNGKVTIIKGANQNLNSGSQSPHYLHNAR